MMVKLLSTNYIKSGIFKMITLAPITNNTNKQIITNHDIIQSGIAWKLHDMIVMVKALN